MRDGTRWFRPNGRATGPRHPRWKGGWYKNENGYLRYTAGPLRGQYVHRVVASRLWEQSYGEPLPPGYEVHHQDFVKDNNVPENLLILGPGLHEASHAKGWGRNRNGTFKRKEREP